MTSWKNTIKNIVLDFETCTPNWNMKGGLITLFFDISFQMLLLYRLFHFLSQRKGLGVFSLPLIYAQKVLTGCYIHPSADLGTNIHFPHPTGIVIGQNVKVGQGVTIFQGVTLGSTGKSDKRLAEYPIIDDNVTLYANAIVIGNVRVGKSSFVGASSLVLQDVPPKVIVAGVPAHILRYLD
jgi:serine O-acetyltransferase